MILNVIGLGMPVLQAMAAPRVHSQLYPDKVQFERLFGLDIAGPGGLLASKVTGGDGGHVANQQATNRGNSELGYAILTPESTLRALKRRNHTLEQAGILGVTQFIGEH